MESNMRKEVSKSNYELIVDDYGDQGAKITMKKKKGYLSVVIIVVFIATVYAAFEEDGFSEFKKLYLGFALASAVLLFIFYHVRKIHSESLMIIASIGITVQQSRLLGTCSRFYEVQQIQDVVIIEAVTMSKIIFQLVLLPKQKDHTCLIPGSTSSHSSSKSKQRLHPLFHCFRPKLEDLQTIYRHIQKKLILPSQINT